MLLLASASCAIAAPAAELEDAIAARLLLMDDVARYKWNHALPVVDAPREAALLERATADAVAIGLPEAYARRIIAAQIDASRAIQLQLVAGWQRDKQPPFTDVPDLATVQRPVIDVATHRLLEHLHTTMCTLAEESTRADLQHPPTSLAQQRRHGQSLPQRFGLCRTMRVGIDCLHTGSRFSIVGVTGDRCSGPACDAPPHRSPVTLPRPTSRLRSRMHKSPPVPGTGSDFLDMQRWCLAPAVTYSKCTAGAWHRQ